PIRGILSAIRFPYGRGEAHESCDPDDRRTPRDDAAHRPAGGRPAARHDDVRRPRHARHEVARPGGHRFRDHPVHDPVRAPRRAREADAGSLNAPCLAESWTMSKDGRTWEFVIRKGARFHNGDPVTAEDVKFSFERYKGAAAPLFKDRVREVQVVDATHVRF